MDILREKASTLLNTYKKLSIPAKASIWFIMCGIFKDAVDVFVTPIFTRILSTDQYGLFNVYNSWYQIFRVLFTLNLCSDVYTVGLTKYEDDKRKYVSSVQGLFTVLLVSLIVIFLISPQKWSALMGISFPLSILMILQIASYVPYVGWVQEKRFEYSYKLFALVNIIYVVLQPTLGYLMIRSNLGRLSPGELRVMGTVSVQIAVGLFIYCINFIRKPYFYNKQIWRFSVGMNVPLIPHFLAQILLLQSAKLIIDEYVGKSATAIYSVANSAAFVIQVVVLNLNSAFLPWLYQKLRKNETDGIRAYTNVLFLLSATSVMLIVLVAPEAMMLLGPEKYREGIWVIPPLAFSVHLMFIYTQFSDFQLYYEKKVRTMFCAIIGTIICMGLGILFVPRFGFVAAGYTTMAGYLSIAVLHYFMLKKTSKEEGLQIRNLFNVKLIIGITVGLAIGGLIITWMYQVSAVFRYILLCIIAVLLVVNKKAILGLFSEFREGK